MIQFHLIAYFYKIKTLCHSRKVHLVVNVKNWFYTSLVTARTIFIHKNKRNMSYVILQNVGRNAYTTVAHTVCNFQSPEPWSGCEENKRTGLWVCWEISRHTRLYCLPAAGEEELHKVAKRSFLVSQHFRRWSPLSPPEPWSLLRGVVVPTHLHRAF